MNWSTEVLRARIVAAVGAERAAAIDPTYPLHWPLTLPVGLDYGASLGTAPTGVHRDDDELLGRQGGEPGSNAWVVGGARTASGGPLLANDPHLNLQMPSLWYEMHLVGGDYAVAGATIPGTPGVVIGHNARIAWGVTNGMNDVQDLYIERFDSDDPAGRRYEFRGAWEEAEVAREAIVVRDRPRGRQTHTETVAVRITRHGPIVNDLIPRADGAAPDEPLALRWTALEPGRLHSSVLAINRAQDWGEFRAALANWTVPTQNFVYADVDGQIGYALGGDLPIRAQCDGLLPVPGWTGEWEWVGIIPPEENPHALNPAEGFVATANNRIVGDDFAHPVIGEWATSYRVSRIRELILRTPRHTAESFARIQADRRSLPGLACIALARDGRLPVAPRDQVAADARDALAAWDGVLSADSVGGLVATVLCQQLLGRAYREVAGPLDTVVGLGAFAGMPGNGYRQRALPNLLDRLLGPDPGWLAQGDSPEAITADAWAATVAALRERWGDEVWRWRYGLAHQFTLRHPLGAIGPLGRLFNRGPITTGGDGETVNMGGLNISPAGIESYAAPSYRQILDPTDWDRSRAIHPTGQSGHPASPHYADFLPLWLTGEYHPMPWTRGAVEEATAHRLTLAPG
jgi:penicillin amidase